MRGLFVGCIAYADDLLLSGSVALLQKMLNICSDHADQLDISYQLDRLRFVMNAAARLIFSSRKYDHVTLLLHELHWLTMRQRIEYKLAVLVYLCLPGLAPPYLASDLQHAADLDDRRRLRSSLTDALNVPSTHLSTVGDCAFPVAAAHVWNSLPATVTSLPSLLTFKRRLKTEMFARSYPDC